LPSISSPDVIFRFPRSASLSWPLPSVSPCIPGFAPLRLAFGAGLAAIFLFCALQTERRVALFFNNYTLLSDTVRKSPNSYIVQGQCASALYDRGDVGGALQHVLFALQLNPDYEMGHLNAGWYYADKGNYDAVIAQFQEAARLYPDYSVPLVNLAKVYTLQHN